MSKIFEALNRSHGEISEAVLSSLAEQTEVEEQTDPIAPLRAAAIAVPSEQITPAKLQDLPEQTSVSAVSMPRSRTLPLRVSASSPLLPFDDSHRQASEQYKIVRTKIIQHPKQPRMILISSAGPGDGKSVSALNLAGALSLKVEANVLMVDADFRKPNVHSQLGLPESPGLADVLKGTCALEDAVVHVEQFPNLCVLCVGEHKSNPPEMLDSSRWPWLCAELRRAFRYIIVDTTPVAAVADYDLIQAACDGVILIVRPDHTNRSLCIRALDMVPREKLLGVLINCAPTDLGSFSGSSYYNYSYAYPGYGQ